MRDILAFTLIILAALLTGVLGLAIFVGFTAVAVFFSPWWLFLVIPVGVFILSAVVNGLEWLISEFS